MGYDMDWVESSENESEDPFVSESYFRVGAFSMGPLRKIMRERGMGHDMRPAFLVYASTDFRTEGHKGIPLTKLSSNDGWLVHPEEIKQALLADILAPVITEDELGGESWDRERWESWLAFMRGAADHGGFKVF